MAHCIDFMKTVCTSKISQISEFQNHIPKTFNFHTYISPSYYPKKNQFSMTDPVAMIVKKQKYFIAILAELTIGLIAYVQTLKMNHKVTKRQSKLDQTLRT